ncbi:hypothetical protein WJX73_007965 [Symbiochloris irregularis]|uniref:STI1 domain-containing protein n=1 Tax=Symbiochloris irregularis TaxID=706552 RepID=A0AAW1NVR5_9CHLO
MPRKGTVPTVASPRRNSRSGGRPNGAPAPDAPANENGQEVSEQLEAITLEDGTQMPVGLPPGMDPGMARELVEYLRKNPEMAKHTYNEAQRLLQANPSMATQLPQLQRMAGMQSPEQQAKLMQLKDDPELKDMFDDIQKHGTGVSMLL